MSAAYVRAYYRVPAARGMRVTVDGRPGVITGFRDAGLRVRFDGETRSTPAHPTWRVQYPTTPTAA
jgi:hypothetical protein